MISSAGPLFNTRRRPCTSCSLNPITILPLATQKKERKEKNTHARLESVVQASMLAGHGNDTDPLFGMHIPYVTEGLLLST